MNSYYMKLIKSSDDIVLNQFNKLKDDIKRYPNDNFFVRDYNFVLSLLLDRGYDLKELEQ